MATRQPMRPIVTKCGRASPAKGCDEDAGCSYRADVQFVHEPADLGLRIPEHGDRNREKTSKDSLVLRHTEEIEPQHQYEGEGRGDLTLAEEGRAE